MVKQSITFVYIFLISVIGVHFEAIWRSRAESRNHFYFSQFVARHFRPLYLNCLRNINHYDKLPTECVCVGRNSTLVTPCLASKKGGMVTLRHNELRDIHHPVERNLQWREDRAITDWSQRRASTIIIILLLNVLTGYLHFSKINYCYKCVSCIKI